MSGAAGDDDEEYNMSKRQFMGGIALLGGYSIIDLADNRRVDGSPFGFISDFLSGNGSSRPPNFTGDHVQNSSDRSQQTDVPQETYDSPQQDTTPEETEPPVDTPEPVEEPTPRPEPDPEPTEPAEDTPENEETPTEDSSQDGYVEDLGPACDRLYISGLSEAICGTSR